MSENRNILIAAFLSLVFLITWNSFFVKNETKNNTQVNIKSMAKKKYLPYDIAIKENGERVFFDNDYVYGSIALKGLKIDDLKLKKYYKTTEKKEKVSTFYPSKTDKSFFAEAGWITNNTTVPDQNTVWQKKHDDKNDQMTFFWENDEKITFIVKISLDDMYVMKIEQIVQNNTDKTIYIRNYNRISKTDPEIKNKKKNMLLHEGYIGNISKDFIEKKYNKIKNTKYNIEKDIKDSKKNYWSGFTEKYWFSALIFDNKTTESLHINHKKEQQSDKFQTHFITDIFTVEPKQDSKHINYVFSGPKKIKILDKYMEDLHIKRFDRALDLGVLYVLTKPMTLFLDFINNFYKNFGITIIVFTLIIKVITLPLTIKSTISTIKMQKLSPQIKQIKNLYKDDNIKISKETMNLFKKNKISPFASIIPLIIQIPIFFALYKVLYVSPDMHLAPFFGWIDDLSVPDPKSVFNFFGAIDWHPPSILANLGALSIILGLTTFIQQHVNKNKNKSDLSEHEKAMKYLPYILVFISASFPAGLILYWITNNVLSTIQQLAIKFLLMKNKND